mgnify:FL=1
MAKKRLDVLVTERGLAESRQKAQALIMAGEVFSGDRKLDKAGMSVEDTIPLEVRGNTLRYVGRGGLKLEKAMEVFPIDLNGCTAADIGASPVGLLTVCCKTERKRFIRWMWATANWPGNCAAMNGS